MQSEEMNIHWEEHQEYVKRLLVGLTRDLDLAEDLLQETYLKAHRGWEAYRGGDVRAWFTSIAKNLFYSHCRRRYVRDEVSLEMVSEQECPYPDQHLIPVMRQAIAGLAPSLRTALLLKHYGGFSYQEIAQRLHCSVGTAKWRVSTAISKVKALLGEKENETMSIPVTRLLDYLYGNLSEREAAAVRAQLAKSEKDRNELHSLEQTLRALDAIESDVKVVIITVLDAAGGATQYASITPFVARHTEVAQEADWTLSDDSEMLYVMVEGQEMPVREVERKDHIIYYKSPLPHPVAPGEVLGPFVVATYSRNAVQSLEDGRRQYRTGGTLGSSVPDWFLVDIVRLPEGAEVVKVDPPADETHINAAVTLTWKRFPTNFPESEPQKWQIDGVVEYRLPEK